MFLVEISNIGKKIIPKKLKWTIISLRISNGLYLILSVGFILAIILLRIQDLIYIITFIAMSVISMAIILVNEFSIRGLKNGKRWAYIVSMVVCAMYISSLFVILGIIGFIGLFDKESQEFLKN